MKTGVNSKLAISGLAVGRVLCHALASNLLIRQQLRRSVKHSRSVEDQAAKEKELHEKTKNAVAILYLMAKEGIEIPEVNAPYLTHQEIAFYHSIKDAPQVAD